MSWVWVTNLSYDLRVKDADSQVRSKKEPHAVTTRASLELEPSKPAGGSTSLLRIPLIQEMEEHTTQETCAPARPEQKVESSSSKPVLGYLGLQQIILSSCT